MPPNNTLSSSNNRSFTLRITFIATLGGLLFGYDTAVISGAVASLNHVFIAPLDLEANAASAMQGFVISAALIGCVLGASVAGYLSQRFGRRMTLFVAAALFFASALGSAYPEMGSSAPSHEFLYHFVSYRVLGGVGVGIASMVSPMYIAEIAPADKRGALVSLNQFAIVFGILLVYFVNYAIAAQGDEAWLHDLGWRYMFTSMAIPSGLFFILLFFAPETPRYLVLRGKHNEAQGLLARLVPDAKAALEEIKHSFAQEVAVSLAPYYRFMASWAGAFVLLFGLLYAMSAGSAFEIAFIASFVIALVIPMKSYGISIITVGVLLSAFQQFVGINAVLYYAPEIFKSMGQDTDAALLQTVVVGAINMLFTVVAIMTVDKFGRKPLLVIGALVMAAAMLGLGFAFTVNIAPIAKLFCMLLYVAGFAMSWGPVCWVMLSEIFPNHLRSAVMSIAVAAQWVSNFLVSWTFPIMNENEALTASFNHGFAYLVYGSLSLCAAIFVYKILPETKGKSLEELENLWKKKS